MVIEGCRRAFEGCRGVFDNLFYLFRLFRFTLTLGLHASQKKN